MASNLPLFNNAAIQSRVLNINMVFLKANDACKSWEENLKITCNYKPGDKVRYEQKNGEILTGTIIYIQCSVGIKDSVTNKEISVCLKDVIGYDK